MATHTCRDCLHTGVDTREEPTWDRNLRRDTTDYFCIDMDACWRRQQETSAQIAKNKALSAK